MNAHPKQNALRQTHVLGLFACIVALGVAACLVLGYKGRRPPALEATRPPQAQVEAEEQLQASPGRSNDANGHGAPFERHAKGGSSGSVSDVGGPGQGGSALEYGTVTGRVLVDRPEILRFVFVKVRGEGMANRALAHYNVRERAGRWGLPFPSGRIEVVLECRWAGHSLGPSTALVLAPNKTSDDVVLDLRASDQEMCFVLEDRRGLPVSDALIRVWRSRSGRDRADAAAYRNRRVVELRSDAEGRACIIGCDRGLELEIRAPSRPTVTVSRVASGGRIEIPSGINILIEPGALPNPDAYHKYGVSLAKAIPGLSTLTERPSLSLGTSHTVDLECRGRDASGEGVRKEFYFGRDFGVEVEVPGPGKYLIYGFMSKRGERLRRRALNEAPLQWIDVERPGQVFELHWKELEQ